VGAGETAVVPPGVRHVWWNGGDDELHAEVEFRPALRVEEFFEVFFGLAAAGRANRRGLPNPLWLAAIGKEFSQEVRLARVPYPLLKIATEPVALLARAVGYRASPEFVSALGR
jgi:hypothetical protein